MVKLTRAEKALSPLWYLATDGFYRPYHFRNCSGCGIEVRTTKKSSLPCVKCRDTSNNGRHYKHPDERIRYTRTCIKCGDVKENMKRKPATIALCWSCSRSQIGKSNKKHTCVLPPKVRIVKPKIIKPKKVKKVKKMREEIVTPTNLARIRKINQKHREEVRQMKTKIEEKTKMSSSKEEDDAMIAEWLSKHEPSEKYRDEPLAQIKLTYKGLQDD